MGFVFMTSQLSFVAHRCPEEKKTIAKGLKWLWFAVKGVKAVRPINELRSDCEVVQMLLWMEEVLHHPGMYQHCESELAGPGFLPTVAPKDFGSYYTFIHVAHINNYILMGFAKPAMLPGTRS